MSKINTGTNASIADESEGRGQLIRFEDIQRANPSVQTEPQPLPASAPTVEHLSRYLAAENLSSLREEVEALINEAFEEMGVDPKKERFGTPVRGVHYVVNHLFAVDSIAEIRRLKVKLEIEYTTMFEDDYFTYEPLILAVDKVRDMLGIYLRRHQY